MAKPVERVYIKYYDEVGTPEADDEEYADDDLPEMAQRQVTQNLDPMADDCQYLSDKEIREFLQWDQLDIAEELKQLCCEYQDIFDSPGRVGEVNILQNSIDT